jgi:hypothetical protein
MRPLIHALEKIRQRIHGTLAYTRIRHEQLPLSVGGLGVQNQARPVFVAGARGLFGEGDGVGGGCGRVGAGGWEGVLGREEGFGFGCVGGISR